MRKRLKCRRTQAERSLWIALNSAERSLWIALNSAERSLWIAFYIVTKD
ncbi:hypothetical protein MAL08_14845 [Leptospira noguchii]|nr:hypothetical protein [Leptospira noguchii]UOG37319.1 hypothetical protein MAL08_14845 [Leptospira noguchii]